MARSLQEQEVSHQIGGQQRLTPSVQGLKNHLRIVVHVKRQGHELHLIRKRHIQRLRTQCVGLVGRWHRDNSIGIANRSHQDIAVAAVWICATGVRYRVR